MSWLISRALMEVYESSRCSQALAEAFSEGNCSAGEQSALSSESPTPQAFLPPDKMTDFCRPSRFGMTFGPLTDDLGAAVLTWFLADSRARTSASPEKGMGLTESEVAYGQKWRGSLARYDHDSRGWKTAQCSLLEDSDEFLETLPRWGTTVNGELYLLPTPALPTLESASGLWPTPTVCGNHNRKGVSATSGDGLATAVRQRVPTPVASMHKGSSPGTLVRKNGRSREMDRLDHYVQTVDGGPLNPEWVEWLMGWPPGLTDLKPLGTDKSHKQQLSPGDC